MAIGRAIDDQRSVLVCLNNLGETACTMGDCASARTYLVEALRLASENQTMIVLNRVLVNLAAFFAQQEQVDRSATLLAVARQQPACEQDTRDKAERLLNRADLTIAAQPWREVQSRRRDRVISEAILEPDRPAVVVWPAEGYEFEQSQAERARLRVAG